VSVLLLAMLEFMELHQQEANFFIYS